MNYEELKVYIENNYNILKYDKGHLKTKGIHANKLKNPVWHVQDKNNNEHIIFIYCEKNTLCKLCPISFQKIIEYEIISNK